MPDVGLLPEGLVIDTFENMVAEIEAELRAEWGASMPLGDGTFDGHVIRILCERLRKIWELLQVSFSSFDPDANNGAMQRAIGAITGTFEIAAAGSVALLTLCGDDGTVIAVDNIVATASTGKPFLTKLEVTFELLDDWQPSTVYDEGDRVTNAGRCYQCVTAGESAGAGGPNTTDETIVDNLAEWTYLGEGDSAGDVVAVSEEQGPIVAAARDLTDIQTPVAGWNTAINLLDAELGRLTMTDEEFRVLREQELAQPGTGTPDAIRAALLQVAGVTNATVFFNNTDDIDDDGMLPHTCEALVQGGADEDIWQCLWDNVPVGIRTVGDEAGFVTDDEGTEQPISFSRPDEVEVYSIVTLEKEAISYGGDDAVKEAIATWGNSQRTGKNVVASAIAAQAFTVDGVLDVSDVKIGTAPAPGASVTIPISRRELAVYDTTRITLITSNGTP